MQTITLRVITGADRGRVFLGLRPPITIGREEGNVVQLNDERVSRFHVKIQEDNGRLVVTDLESTNGTKVNGHSCNLKILRYGDTISVGRSVLLVGTREQVASWLNGDDSRANEKRADGTLSPLEDDDGDIDGSTDLVASPRSPRPKRRRPSLPRGLTPGQAAELRELLDHVHESLQNIYERASVEEDRGRVVLDLKACQLHLSIQSELAEFIRGIEDPQSLTQRPSDIGPE